MPDSDAQLHPRRRRSLAWGEKPISLEPMAGEWSPAKQVSRAVWWPLDRPLPRPASTGRPPTEAERREAEEEEGLSREELAELDLARAEAKAAYCRHGSERDPLLLSHPVTRHGMREDDETPEMTKLTSGPTKTLRFQQDTMCSAPRAVQPQAPTDNSSVGVRGVDVSVTQGRVAVEAQDVEPTVHSSLDIAPIKYRTTLQSASKFLAVSLLVPLLAVVGYSIALLAGYDFFRGSLKIAQFSGAPKTSLGVFFWLLFLVAMGVCVVKLLAYLRRS